MSPLLIAAALVFAPPDAHLAYEKAKDLVENCTPRDAGTPQCGYFAANRILDAASAAGANVRRDYFRAETPKGERRFTNLHAEFKCGDTNAPWIVLLSHYDTKPGCGCPGANDGASTSGLLIGFANAFSNWREPKANAQALDEGAAGLLCWDLGAKGWSEWEKVVRPTPSGNARSRIHLFKTLNGFDAARYPWHLPY